MWACGLHPEPFWRRWRGQAPPHPQDPEGVSQWPADSYPPIGSSYHAGFCVCQEQRRKTGTSRTEGSRLIVTLAHIIISENRSQHLKIRRSHLQMWMFCYFWKMGRTSNTGLLLPWQKKKKKRKAEIWEGHMLPSLSQSLPFLAVFLTCRGLKHAPVLLAGA